MARKSSVSRLPPDIKSYIEAMLATGAQTLDELIDDLQQRFPAQAHAGSLPSRSALHRYGSKLDRRLSAIRASTEAAKIIRAQIGDHEDARSEALTAMIQSELFESILDIQAAGEEGADGEKKMDAGDRIALLSKAAKNIATLTTSSIRLKKFQTEVVAQARRELLAEQEANLQEVVKAQGMDEAQADLWRRKILGIG